MAASMVRRLAVNLLSRGSLIKQVEANTTARCLTTLSSPMKSPGRPSAQPCISVSNPVAVDNSSMLLKVCQPFVSSVRTVIRYDRRTGQPQTEQDVIDRFFRLRWGIYIRPRAGRHKHKWKKPDWINERGKYHVFCNKQQSRMLDKMTTKEWKKPRYYVNDPYEPYHKRTGMPKDYKVPKFHP